MTDAHQYRGQRGFTLVELMVVVAIVALIAAIIIPNFVHARAQAAVSASQATMKQIATSLELYFADNEAYPGASGPVSPALFGGATNRYLTATPTNALGRKAYAYTNVPAAGGLPETYTLDDPGIYEPSTLQSIPKGKGSGASCGATGCTSIHYDPQDGFYGS